MVLLWPRQPLAFTDDIKSFDLLKQILLQLVNFNSDFLFIDPIFANLSEVFLDLFLPFGGHFLEVGAVFF